MTRMMATFMAWSSSHSGSSLGNPISRAWSFLGLLRMSIIFCRLELYLFELETQVFHST